LVTTVHQLLPCLPFFILSVGRKFKAERKRTFHVKS
jgi:hypothetical protein